MLAEHLLLLPRGCSSLLTAAARKRLLPRIVGIATAQLSVELGLAKGDCAVAACLSVGLPVDMLPAGAKLKAWDEPLGLEAWVEARCQTVSVGFVSLIDVKLYLRWKPDALSPEGVDAAAWRHSARLSPKSNNGSTINYRDEHWSLARLGDTFEMLRPDDGSVVLRGTVAYDGAHVIGDVPPHDLTMPSWRDYGPDVKRSYADNLVRMRNVHRHFTDVGFATAELPRSVWAAVRAYHHNNQHVRVPEEWNAWADTLSQNFWAAPSFIIPIPPELKQSWQAGLRPHVDAWIGAEAELQFNALYGMRVYTEGAELFSHVDRAPTHALSIVVNVAQDGMREPWPIELDCSNASTDAELPLPDALPAPTLSAGQMLFYESARCLHGRRRPLRGRTFTNLFVHYSPKGEPDWFKSEWQRANAEQQQQQQLPTVTTAAASVLVFNEAEAPLEVYWLPPPSFEHGTAPYLISKIPAREEWSINGRVGDRYMTKGACEEKLQIGSNDDTFRLCHTEVSRAVFDAQLVASMRQYMDPGHALFRNLCSRSLRMWEASAQVHAQAPKGHDGLAPNLYNGAPGRRWLEIRPGNHQYVNLPRGSIVCVNYDGDMRGCTEPLYAFQLGYSDDVYFSFDDGSGDAETAALWAEEKRQGLEYTARVGRPWLVPRGVVTKAPVDMHMHLPSAVGETRTVRTHEPRSLCAPRTPDDQQGSCAETFELKLRALSVRPAAWQIDDFLSDEEAEHLIAAGEARMQRSTAGTGDVLKTRTSRTAWIERASSSMTERISRRAADALGVEERVLYDGLAAGAQSELAQLVQYRAGDKYDAHTDWALEPENQPRLRWCTLLIYLRVPAHGGGTGFPLANTTEPLVVAPRKNAALLFYNLLPDGNVDVDSLHMGLPVHSGQKWILNLWTHVHNGSEPAHNAL